MVQNGKHWPGLADKTLMRPVQGSRSYEVMPGQPALQHRRRADRSKQRQTPGLGAASQIVGHAPQRLLPVSTSSFLDRWFGQAAVAV